jgi:GNAT superfamily N-acetyltransferase
MIGTMSAPALDPAQPGPTDRHPDAALPELIRSTLAGSPEGTGTYLEIGARMDRVSAVRAGRSAVAWQSLHATWDRPWIIGMGPDPAEVARCVAELAAEVGPPEGVTVARAAFPRLPDALRPVEHWEWDWWYTTRPPGARPGQAHVVPLAADDPRINELLDAASPDAMARPGDRRVLGWSGIESGAVARAPSSDAGPGLLVAVAAVTTMRPGIPHLSSVATREQWRGQGLARDLCGQMTSDALEHGAPAVTLGMHAGNRAARRVYDSLGYRVGYRWASGRLTHRQRPDHSGA